MSLFLSLGVNPTLLIQLGIFLTVYAVLKYVLFGPYFKAFNQRNESTVGQTELAERYVNETKALEEEFAVKAKSANEKFRSVYDQTRAEALKEYDRLVNEARAQSKTLIDGARVKIQKEIEGANSQLIKEVPDVVNIINQKLLGKDMST